MRNKIPVPFLLIAAGLLMSCAGDPVEEKPAYLSGADYYQQTVVLLDMETDYRFWEVLQEFDGTFPSENKRLLEEYGRRQMALASHFLKQEEFSSALYHLNNLLALPEDAVDGDKFAEMEQEIRLAVNDSHIVYLDHLRSEGAPTPTEGSAASDPMDSIAEVSVRYFWKSSEDMERFNLGNVDGTAFLVTPRHALTAFHVVEEAFDDFFDRYEITLRFGEETVEGVNILAWDALTDLAILELPEALERPFLIDRIIASDGLEQGDTVFALGHPYGFSNTLTKGIISAKSRPAPEWGEWLQVDAVSAPGMSGGILANEEMKIMGMVVAGFRNDEMNFAVPSNLILEELNGLISGETRKRPWAGILFNEDMEVVHVFEESPLAAMNLKPGHILVSINGQDVDSVLEAQSYMDRLETGNRVSLVFSDGKERRTHYVALMRRPTEAMYNKLFRMDIYERVRIAAGILLDEESASVERLRTSHGDLVFQVLEIASIDENSYLYSQAVRTGDSLGLLQDGFDEHDYYIEVLHLPEGKGPGDLNNIGDMVFTIHKGRYDENIL